LSNPAGACETNLLPIGAVVAALQQRYPDVSHSSLRFLEREGLITATRTAGGHRLYSSADLARIEQIKEWQRENHSLEEIKGRLARLDRLPEPARLADTFLHRLLEGELEGAYRLILEADEIGMPMARLFGDVLQPALAEIGHRWEQGTLMVAQEKEASELVREVIADLSLKHATLDPGAPQLIAACVAGERHELGVRMVCGLLRERGCLVRYLGVDVEPRFLLEALRMHRPEAMLLSARLEPNLPAVQDAIERVKSSGEAGYRPTVIVGGLLAMHHADLIREWGAEPITSNDPEESAEAILALLRPPEASEVS
jgi:methanogenic corrinoid protein MtbC1